MATVVIYLSLTPEYSTPYVSLKHTRGLEYHKTFESFLTKLSPEKRLNEFRRRIDEDSEGVLRYLARSAG